MYWFKDWELGATREQHEAENIELAEAFEKLYLDEEEGSGSGAAVASGTGT
jgi:hypothetical protein